MPKLLIDEGGQAHVFELFEDEISIGRGASNGVQVADGHASKHHAVIRNVGGRLKLVDLESKNGTMVNGEYRNQRWLEHGDAVTIGAATMTFDASDVAAAPAPVARSSARAVSLAAAAPAPSYAPAPAPVSRTRPSSRRARERDEDDEEDGGRVPPRRGGNSAVVAVGVGAGVLGVVAILFLLLSHGGHMRNAGVLQQAKEMVNQGKHAEALAYLKKNGDPTDKDGYVNVDLEIKSLEATLAAAPAAAREDEARFYYSHTLERTRIEMWKGTSKEQMGALDREFADKYMGTAQVHELLNSPYDPYPKHRVLMGDDKAWDEMSAIQKSYEAWRKHEEWKEGDKASPEPPYPKQSEAEIGSRILDFQKKFAGTMKVQELERSALDPYPALRKLAHIDK